MRVVVRPGLVRVLGGGAQELVAGEEQQEVPAVQPHLQNNHQSVNQSNKQTATQADTLKEDWHRI